MVETIKINDDTWRFEDGGVRFFLFCGKGTLIPVKEGDVIDLGDRLLKIIDILGHTPQKYRSLY